MKTTAKMELLRMVIQEWFRRYKDKPDQGRAKLKKELRRVFKRRYGKPLPEELLEAAMMPPQGVNKQNLN